MFHNVYSDSPDLDESAREYIQKQSEIFVDMVCDKTQLSKDFIKEIFNQEYIFTYNFRYLVCRIGGIFYNTSFSGKKFG